MRPPQTPEQRRRFARRFLAFQLLFTAAAFAVVLSRPFDPRHVTALVVLTIATLAYGRHVLSTSRRTPRPRDRS